MVKFVQIDAPVSKTALQHGVWVRKKTLKSSCPKLVLLSLEGTLGKTIPWMA